MNSLTVIVVVGFLLLAVVGLLAILFGGPSDPPPMAAVNDPCKSLTYSDLPAPSQFVARDGEKLTFRTYLSAGEAAMGSVVLVHGSSARGRSMHFLAKAFAASGFTAYALDVRGHGESGVKGHIAYVGQLEDDLEDFVRSVRTAQPSTLAGFSSGGGFVLRFAGSARQNLFANYLLLSPFISHKAPTYRPNSGGWVRVGIPRYIAIELLNSVGVRALNDLPVIKFALDDEGKAVLTPQYAFALAQNFRPEQDYRANIRALKQPVRVVAGKQDEAFYAEQFASVFNAEGKDVAVTLVPGIGHISLVLEPAAVDAVVEVVKSFNEARI